MPTDQKLDDATEERIRAACPRHSQRGAPADEGFAWDLATCTCPVQRAAIRADREARGPSADEVLALRCLTHARTLPVVNMPDGKECAICLRAAEIAHADRLAEAHKQIAALADVVSPTAELATAVGIARAALREHEERRR